MFSLCRNLKSKVENLLNGASLLIKELAENADDDPANDQLIEAIKKIANAIRLLIKMIEEKCDPEPE